MNPARHVHNKRRFPFHILVFLAPAVIIYTLFMTYPLVDSLRLSLYTSDQYGNETFIGLDNYRKLMTDPLWEPRLKGAILNNIEFFAIHMFVQNPIGLLLAALLSSPFIRGRAIYRTLIFTPTVLSVVLIGFIWSIILSPLWGISGDFLTSIGLEQYAKKPWLGLESTALPTLSLVSVWQWVGIPMMLFLAALIAIPDELVEAARVDGAGPWRFFKDILLPLSKTNIAALFVILFIYGWTQYLWPLLVTNRNDMNTIVIALRKMISFADADTQWHLVMVTCVLAILPPILVVVLMQRWFVKGLVETEK